MTLRELTALTGVAERQVRYLIAEGFVPPPSGGRAHADYGDEQVAAIRRYAALKAAGLPPSAIRVVLADGAAVPFPVAPGLALLVSPALLGTPQDVDALARDTRILLQGLFQENSHDSSSSHDPQ